MTCSPAAAFVAKWVLGGQFAALARVDYRADVGQTYTVRRRNLVKLSLLSISIATAALSLGQDNPQIQAARLGGPVRMTAASISQIGETLSEAEKLSGLRQRLAVLRSRLTSSHPDVRLEQSEIDRMEAAPREESRIIQLSANTTTTTKHM